MFQTRCYKGSSSDMIVTFYKHQSPYYSLLGNELCILNPSTDLQLQAPVGGTFTCHWRGLILLIYSVIQGYVYNLKQYSFADIPWLIFDIYVLIEDGTLYTLLPFLYLCLSDSLQKCCYHSLKSEIPDI